MWPWGFLSLIANVLIWGLIIYLIVHLVRKMASSHHQGGCCGMHGSCDHEEDKEEVKNDEYYLNIVKERYAKGEIDKKHYDELKKDFSPVEETEEVNEVKA